MARNVNIYDGGQINFFATNNAQTAVINLLTTDILQIGGTGTGACGLLINSLDVSGTGSHGTIVNAVWNGDTIGVGYGGLGLTAIAAGAILYASATNTYTTLAPAATDGMVLVAAAGTPNTPSWSYTIGKAGQTLKIAGNLEVDGTTTYIHTSQMTIDDNIITLNSGVTGVPTTNGGLEINRGSSTKSNIIWFETGTDSTSYWAAGIAGSEDILILATKNSNSFFIKMVAS